MDQPPGDFSRNEEPKRGRHGAPPNALPRSRSVDRGRSREAASRSRRPRSQTLSTAILRRFFRTIDASHEASSPNIHRSPSENASASAPPTIVDNRLSATGASYFSPVAAPVDCIYSTALPPPRERTSTPKHRLKDMARKLIKSLRARKYSGGFEPEPPPTPVVEHLRIISESHKVAPDDDDDGFSFHSARTHISSHSMLARSIQPTCAENNSALDYDSDVDLFYSPMSSFSYISEIGMKESSTACVSTGGDVDSTQLFSSPCLPPRTTGGIDIPLSPCLSDVLHLSSPSNTPSDTTTSLPPSPIALTQVGSMNVAIYGSPLQTSSSLRGDQATLLESSPSRGYSETLPISKGLRTAVNHPTSADSWPTYPPIPYPELKIPVWGPYPPPPYPDQRSSPTSDAIFVQRQWESVSALTDTRCPQSETFLLEIDGDDHDQSNPVHSIARGVSVSGPTQVLLEPERYIVTENSRFMGVLSNVPERREEHPTNPDRCLDPTSAALPDAAVVPPRLQPTAGIPGGPHTTKPPGGSWSWQEGLEMLARLFPTPTIHNRNRGNPTQSTPAPEAGRSDTFAQQGGQSPASPAVLSTAITVVMQQNTYINTGDNYNASIEKSNVGGRAANNRVSNH